MCLVGVVVRRYIDFLILLIPTPYVSAFSEGSTFCSFFCFSFLFQYIFIIYLIIFRHSSIIITCCIMHYNYIQNWGHVCHTHIKGYAMGRIYRFPQKNAAATIYFSANAIWGLFEGGYYSKCGVYSRKYGKRGRAQPSFKARAIVYRSSNTGLPNAGH